MRRLGTWGRIAGLVAVVTACRASIGWAQGSTLIGLVDNATDVAFFWQRVGASAGNVRPSGKSAQGLGFEFAFAIPSAVITRSGGLLLDQPKLSAGSCAARYKAGEHEECADTTWTVTERDIGPGGAVVIKQSVKDVKKFDPSARAADTITVLELALGFSQAGSFQPRVSTDTALVSIREVPSASVYATFFQRWPVSPYVGFRTGLLTLQGGRYYHGGTMTKFGGDTFQLGGVVGLVAEIYDLNLFIEGSYMRRSFDSIEWDSPPPDELRALSFTGRSFAFGAQLHFRDHAGK